MTQLDGDIKEILYTEEQIREKVKELGKKISEDYDGKDLVMVGILKGSIPFMADLIRKTTIPCTMDF
ncbi:MAG TPA: phosphoribosyltransferase family protein, partial [Clostridiaceae bacterium]